MGFIPLIIALLAFVLLLVLVNLNSIKSRQQSLGMALFTVCQTARSRNALLKRLRGVQKNQLCPDLPADFRLMPKQFPEVASFISSEWKSLDEAAHFLKSNQITPATRRYSQSLEVLNHRQRINLRTFERKVREYNKLIEHNPTAMVAFMYRLKPIRIPVSRKQS